MFNLMLKKSLLLLPALFPALAAFSQGHNIHLSLKPFANSQVYLGYHYGKVKAVADSITLNANAEGDFKGKESLQEGVYFIVSPQKEILFELLIGRQQHFSVSADTSRLPQSIVFTGSPENKTFQEYTVFMNSHGREIAGLQGRLSHSGSKKDSAAIREELRKENELVRTYREQVEKKDSGSLLSTLLLAMREPVVPPATTAAEKADKNYAYRYYKDHYWDNVSFTDDRLIRTPVFEPKLDRYFKDLVSPDPDSINREIDHMLLYSRTNKEMFKYLLVHFVQKYVNPDYMGQDAVFVHLFEKYINTGQAEFFTEKYRKFVDDRAYSLMANLIGQPAPELTMTDTLGKVKTLYEVNADFVVICFWDPTCSHCKETVPKLDSIYQAKWKGEGVKLMGVMVDGGKDNWIKFIEDHNLKDWIHVYQTTAQHDADASAGRPDYRQLYDVYQTPILYLLDKSKRIVAKKLTYQQLDEVLNLKLKKANS
ncbi:MAG TPA: redoxin domain-containing protein [Puia sp.]|jgi:peroxiredoxin|nr:redoxin domain-containing protein [Puia sp.]